MGDCGYLIEYTQVFDWDKETWHDLKDLPRDHPHVLMVVPLDERVANEQKAVKAFWERKGEDYCLSFQSVVSAHFYNEAVRFLKVAGLEVTLNHENIDIYPDDTLDVRLPSDTEECDWYRNIRFTCGPDLSYVDVTLRRLLAPSVDAFVKHGTALMQAIQSTKGVKVDYFTEQTYAYPGTHNVLVNVSTRFTPGSYSPQAETIGDLNRKIQELCPVILNSQSQQHHGASEHVPSQQSDGYEHQSHE